MSGHRKKPDAIVNTTRFLHEATEMHQTVNGYLDNLRTSSPHYKLLADVREKLVEAIRGINGEVPWGQIKPNDPYRKT